MEHRHRGSSKKLILGAAPLLAVLPLITVARSGPQSSGDQGKTSITIHSSQSADEVYNGDSVTISGTLVCCESPNTCHSLQYECTLESGKTPRQMAESVESCIEQAISAAGGFCGIGADDVTSSGRTVTIYGTNPDGDPCKPASPCLSPPGSQPNQTKPYGEQRSYNYSN